MDERVLAVAAAHGGLVSCRDAEAAGISRSCLRWAHQRGFLVPVRQGAWCPADVWEGLNAASRHRLAVRALQRARPPAVACAHSAAVCLGLPLRDDPPAEPVVTTARAADRRGGMGSRGGGHGRRAWLDPGEVLTLPDGTRVTTPARTVVDLARHVDLPWALAAADAVRLLHGTTRQELLAAAARNPCAPGHPAAVLVAKHADPRAESPLESVARGVMLRLALPLPDLQVWLGGYRVDLLVRQHWTVVEADGKVKYRDEDPTAVGRVWEDKRRRDHLHDGGWEVVRFVMADYRAQCAWGRRCVRAFERAHERRGLPLPDWGSLLKWL